MQTKLEQIRQLWATGGHIAALRIAAKFPQLGEHKAVITRAWAAYTNPDFYRQIGHDPDALVASGIDALAHRYNLPRDLMGV